MYVRYCRVKSIEKKNNVLSFLYYYVFRVYQKTRRDTMMSLLQLLLAVTCVIANAHQTELEHHVIPYKGNNNVYLHNILLFLYNLLTDNFSSNFNVLSQIDFGILTRYTLVQFAF